MNIYDAAKILGLSGNLNPQDTKAAYRGACKKYHPDINPAAGEEMMKIVNQAFDVLKDYTGEIKSDQSDYGQLLNEALNAILGLSGVIIEICGSWVWVTGETRLHKEVSDSKCNTFLFNVETERNVRWEQRDTGTYVRANGI